jgi:hypothetical protein
MFTIPTMRIHSHNMQRSSFILESIILKSSNPSYNVVIAVCFASVVTVLLVVASSCYCYRVRKKRKNDFPTGG